MGLSGTERPRGASAPDARRHPSDFSSSERHRGGHFFFWPCRTTLWHRRTSLATNAVLHKKLTLWPLGFSSLGAAPGRALPLACPTFLCRAALRCSARRPRLIAGLSEKPSGQSPEGFLAAAPQFAHEKATGETIRVHTRSINLMMPSNGGRWMRKCDLLPKTCSTQRTRPLRCGLRPIMSGWPGVPKNDLAFPKLRAGRQCGEPGRCGVRAARPTANNPHQRPSLRHFKLQVGDKFLVDACGGHPGGRAPITACRICGYGSGRQGGRVTVESTLRLDVADALIRRRVMRLSVDQICEDLICWCHNGPLSFQRYIRGF
jgi:hypothetical protein